MPTLAELAESAIRGTPPDLAKKPSGQGIIDTFAEADTKLAASAVAAADAAQAVIVSAMEEIDAAVDLAQAQTRDEYGILVLRGSGVVEGGYYAEPSVTRPVTIDRLTASVLTGTGQIDFSVSIAGVSVYSGTFSNTTPLVLTGLAIPVATGNSIIVTIGYTDSTVSQVAIKLSGRP